MVSVFYMGSGELRIKGYKVLIRLADKGLSQAAGGIALACWDFSMCRLG